METTTAPPPGLLARVRPLLKLLSLGVLVLLLLVPVAQLLGLVRERRSREQQVRHEIAGLWGGEQTLGALVLAVPYRAKALPPAPVASPPAGAAGGGWIKVAPAAAVDPPGWMYFLPADVHWRGTVRPEVRRRGIFEVPLYEAALQADGWFRRPDATALGVTADRVDWAGARAVLLVGDTRGLQRKVALRWNGAERAFRPGAGPVASWPTAVQASLGAGALTGERLPFHVELVVRGSEALRMMPLGESTRVELASTWPDPSFTGAPLPSERRVGEAGFTAVWDVPYFGRSFPQQWRQGGDEDARMQGELAAGAFGVSLVRPADPYQQTERAVKYAVLFILLTFTTVFLLELLSPVRLHPVHYLLVGSALCLFYLLLLALAEHLGMGPAYAIATVGVVGVVGLYARSVLAGWGRAAVLGGALAALYGWLYTVLRAEDYALLLGALGLFATLAAVMYLTRRLDWGTLRFREPTVREG